ncbi:toll-like receptor Tollo [Lingula anatina]|uniref:Toll-like receptor Tollo n=1 Tax=Lingula anatina TaxID=7574 RepID=A0A1S3IEW7_LINAN|nr:toll-like receptor Tollo [Lingula anatina]|eukprot:XP_013396777.2 toll-like receptor Tollo [Lingula anatina]
MARGKKMVSHLTPPCLNLKLADTAFIAFLKTDIVILFVAGTTMTLYGSMVPLNSEYRCRSRVLLEKHLHEEQLALRHISFIEPLIHDKQFQYLSKLRSLSLKSCNISYLNKDAFYGLDLLEVLDLSELTVNELNGHPYSFNLKKLKLQDLPQLQILDISSNNAYLHCDIQSADYFKGMPNLRALHMHRNRLWLTNAPTLLVMFQSLHNVTFLELSSNVLSELPVGMFDSMVRLRTLRLSRNILRTIPKGLFKNLNQLHTLVLSFNYISNIQDGAFDGLISLRVLKMGNNKLICDCNIRWLQQYFQRFDKEDSKEFCFGTTSSKRIPITEFKPDWWQCDNNTTKVAVSILGVVLFMCFIAGIVYYARWDIRFALVVRFGWQCCTKKPQDADVNLEKIFDAFVSYSLLDTAWIVAELIPNLENDEQFNFRLCIHERNFLPGNSIVESVEGAMDGSYSVIFWITQNFLESDDCDFELNLAKTKLSEGNIRSVIFIFEERFDKTQLPQPMGIMIRHCQCLYWPDLRLRKRDIFWKRLKLALLDTRPKDN